MTRLFLALILLALAVPTLVGCGSSSSAPAQEQGYTARVQHVEVEVAPVVRQSLSSDVQFTGSLLPRRYTRIVAEVDGIVRSIPQIGMKIDVEHQGQRYSEQLGITYGQAVKKGDVLMQLDTRDFEIELLVAEAKLKKVQADLAKLMSWQRPEEVQRITALRNEMQARYEQATTELNRIAPLVNTNVVSRSEYDRARTEVSTTKAALDAAQANLTSAGAGPTSDEIAIEKALVAQAEAEVQQKQRMIEKATVRAPYDGIVTKFGVEEGDRVSAANGAVIELMDMRFLIAEVGVPEAYVGSIAVNDQASVRVAGQSEPVAGLVVAINDLVDAQSRTFPVRIAIDNLNRKFKAGQFAEVQLEMSAGENQVLAIPSRAIVFLEGQPNVFILEGSQVRLKPIKIGMSSAINTEVMSGLNEGEVVVTDDPTLLSDGMNVSVKAAMNEPAAAPLADAETLPQPTS